jgi:hypothetical protein
MTRAIKPRDSLARLAARNAALLQELLEPEGRDGKGETLARFLLLKTFDIEWTEQVAGLLAMHPGAAVRYARMPLRGDPEASGDWGQFRRDLYRLLRRHYLNVLFLDGRGAFCGLRLRPRGHDVPVGGQARRGRWGMEALLAKHSFNEHTHHYLRRLSGATLKACASKRGGPRGSATPGRCNNFSQLRLAEFRLRKLVAACCWERRPAQELSLRSRRAGPSPSGGS